MAQSVGVAWYLGQPNKVIDVYITIGQGCKMGARGGRENGRQVVCGFLDWSVRRMLGSVLKGMWGGRGTVGKGCICEVHSRFREGAKVGWAITPAHGKGERDANKWAAARGMWQQSGKFQSGLGREADPVVTFGQI